MFYKANNRNCYKNKNGQDKSNNDVASYSKSVRQHTNHVTQENKLKPLSNQKDINGLKVEATTEQSLEKLLNMM